MNILSCDIECVQGYDGKSILAKCAIVNQRMEIVLNITVKPNRPVRNYVTWITGIRRGDLENGMENEKALMVIREILNSADICVFHDYTNDLKVLQFLPRGILVDTSTNGWLISQTGLTRKSNERVGLKLMAKALLGVDIQKGVHTASIDALTTMRLYRLIQGKCAGPHL